MIKKNILTIGFGEVGRSVDGLYDIESDIEYDRYYIDVNGSCAPLNKDIDVMHICIPFIKEFVKVSSDYMKMYKPALTIIHSTVDIGTTRKIKELTDMKIVHSPLMGVHPNLTKSMQTFQKIIGGFDDGSTDAALSHFTDLNIAVYLYESPENSEAAKMLSTSYYGWNITYMRNVKKFCDDNKLNFEYIYTKTNEIYNEGFKEMGVTNVQRPVLKFVPGKYGGHCIRQNLEILKDKFPLAKFMIEEDDASV